MDHPRDKARNRGKTLNCYVELRRPHTSESTTEGNGSTTPSDTSDLPVVDTPKENSQSSAHSNAMPTSMSSTSGEFPQAYASMENVIYPYTFTSEAVNVPANTSSSLLDPRLSEAVKNSKLSPLAKEFVPRTFVEPNNTGPTTLEYMMCLVEEFIEEVTLNPGKFDEEVILLTETLNVMIKTNELTKTLINTIFRQAVLEANFRYNGARLCKHLIHHLVNDPSAKTFKFLLLEKCQIEYEERHLLTRVNPEYLRGLTFFFGEIYSQILQNNNRIQVFRVAIIYLLESLLTEPSPENFKCICQVLKMTGANIEDDERNANEEEKKEITWVSLDRVLTKLKTSSPPPDLQNMVSNVIQLQSLDWGRSSLPVVSHPPPVHMVVGGAVFYGPDGLPISNEEALFLESQSYLDYRLDTYDEDFNDEIAADYESFLREMGQ